MAQHQDESYDAYSHIPIADLPDAANHALQQIADNLQRQQLAPVIPKYAVAPVRVYDGLLIFADGDNFNPGFGRGVYVWDSAIDINGVLADGQLVGTIPVWAPAGNYNISVNFLSTIGSPAQAQAIISSLQPVNNRSVFGQLVGNEIIAEHQSGSAGGTGEVTSGSALIDDQLTNLTMRVNSGIASIEITVSGVTFTSTFIHQGPPSFTTIFNDTTFGIADGIFVSRIVLNDILGGDNRAYLLDDGITGTIVDSAPGGQDGTWSNILAGNVIQQSGAWVPLHNV